MDAPNAQISCDLSVSREHIESGQPQSPIPEQRRGQMHTFASLPAALREKLSCPCWAEVRLGLDRASQERDGTWGLHSSTSDGSKSREAAAVRSVGHCFERMKTRGWRLSEKRLLGGVLKASAAAALTSSKSEADGASSRLSLAFSRTSLLATFLFVSSSRRRLSVSRTSSLPRCAATRLCCPTGRPG